MKKKFLLIVLLVLSISSIFASSLTYVYESSFSSVDIGRTHKGAVYKDDGNNLFIVSQNREDVAEFDIVRKVSPIKIGSELTRRGPLFFIGLTGGLKKASAVVSVTGPLYPLSFTASFDYSYEKNPMAFAGLRTEVPLSIVSESDFTLIKNGSAFAYAMGGTVGFEEFSFATKWGLGYRHIIGNFYWSAGFDEIWLMSSETNTMDLALSVGVML